MRLSACLGTVIASVLVVSSVFGQADSDSARLEAALKFRTLRATHIAGAPPILDGRLDDTAWQSAEPAGDFVQQSPRPGALPTQRTDVRVLYDDHAIYFGVRAYDEHPDSIVAPYARRDDETRSEWLFVEIDSRHDRRTGFGFGVNPRGVQVDASFDRFINYDNAWNGVWEAVPRIDSLGWVAEFRIPFSQLVYQNRAGEPLTFGLNVYRNTTRSGESSNWSPRLPAYSDLVSHFNDLSGILAPASPERMEIVPYSAAKATYAPRVAANPFTDFPRTSAYAGADFRYRLTPGFTLTGAIHPDFGQVEADPSEVNLTTFETFFTEQRPFFVEDQSQFGFDLSLPFQTRDNSLASEQSFYSRRIGRPPHGSTPRDAVFSQVPTSTTLLGAAKVSGRTANGWTVGMLGSVTGSATARFVDSLGAIRLAPVDPTTEVGVARVSHESSDGGSSVGGIITGLNRSSMRGALDSIVPERAFTLGTDVRHRFAGANWEVSGFLLGSRVEGSSAAITHLVHGSGHFWQRPDAAYLRDDSTATSLTGVAAQLRLGKIGGAFRYGAATHLISPGFEINDVGFQRNADWLIATGWWSYEKFAPGRPIRHWIVGSERIGRGWSFGGEHRASVINGYVTIGFRNYWSAKLAVTHDFSSLSLEELRGGPALKLPARTSLSHVLQTDGRRAWQVVFTGQESFEPGSGSHSVDLLPSLTWHATDRLGLSLGPTFSKAENGWQYVDQPHEQEFPGQPHYVLARLSQTTASLTARVDLAFSSRMTLQLYAQPFVSAGHYTSFKEVRDARTNRARERVIPFLPRQITLDPASQQYRVDLDGDGTADLVFAQPDFNEKSFNANVVFRWEFSPGSTIYLIWTQERTQALGEGSFDLNRDIGRLFRAPAVNVLLIKGSYRFAW
ncbi:MAG: DUF5916 domain-containing protein [Gemmatimonadota bacterium]